MSEFDASAAGSSALRSPPLHEFWAARSQQNDWMRLGGMTLPGVLDDWQAETAALAGSSGFADLSWRHVYRFSGSGLSGELGRLFDLPPAFASGRWHDVTWQDQRGYLRGGGRLAILDQNQALLCSYARDLAWLTAAAGHGLEVAQLHLQGLRLAGPTQRTALQALGASDSETALSPPGMEPIWADIRERGYTDLWCHPDQAYALAHLLSRNGARPAGVRALEAWRVQAGLARVGADWLPVQDVLDLAAARRSGELSGPAGSFYVAELPALGSSGRFSSVVHWPPTDQIFGIGWSLLGQYQEPKNGNAARFLKAAATD